MAKTVDDFNKKRLRSSNITVVVSISLVLFLVGLFGLILINARSYSDYIKEQLVVNAFFSNDYSAKDSLKIEKQQTVAFENIKSLPFVQRATFISREQAAKEARKDMGVDTETLFDKNIFPASVEVALKPDYVDPAKIDQVVKKLSEVQGIVEVKNNSALMIEVYNNLNRILTWILALSGLFLILAIVLINNSIKLKIFSKRFIIKTMQLVGAKRRFILKPFITEAVVLGLIGAIIGLTILFGLWYYFTTQVIGTPFIQDSAAYLKLVILVFSVGVLITVISTIFATWRFLRSNIDDLYYS
ncbi:cell division protein FtsX [Riemerella columbipharyngis]|uniref:Cell division protein FtsX n=1 Tax=Riemerella columbipharyngis TaxID=1071918 RepID=A0A1G7FT52_9FLAO|nr:permease-like cell division protein FtsX [Riemerella columbipharyngis]SDE78875.1 cell division transport system permease protein [Riemerella columbipharyngis]